MNLRRLDVRMALPFPPRSACVLGALPHWREGLETVGVELLDGARSGTVDLIVAPAELTRTAVAGESPMLILEGRGARRPLHRAGITARRFLPLPPGDDPDLLLSLEGRIASGYALRHLRPRASLAKRMRNAAIEAAIALDAFPDLAVTQTIGQRSTAKPFLLEHARAFGIDPAASWFQTSGGGDPLTRGVFHLFPAGARKPQWVVKFARIPGRAEQFKADERGLGLVAQIGGVAAAHAPQLLGRFSAGGFEASAETAIAGDPLSQALTGASPRAHRLALLERVARWTVELARTTRAAPPALAAELDRLSVEVLPRWRADGARDGLVASLPPLPAVLTHNDLGSWNVIVDGAQFGAVDWESANRLGMPLWDVLYFLTDSLALLGGASGIGERVEGSLRLLRGQHPESRVLFRWLREAALVSAVPLDAVGAIATLCWLHHGLSHVRRWSASEGVQPGSGTFLPAAEQIAPYWLSDPALGEQWPAWRAFLAATG